MLHDLDPGNPEHHHVRCRCGDGVGAGGLMFFTDVDTGPLTIIGIVFIALSGVRLLDR